MTTSDLLRDDAAARQAALAVERSFIVQAPAGSGKTELLTQRFLALLAVVERPEALLAITFTRKAAAEMRNRILEALRLCRDEASSLRAETRSLAVRVLEVDAHRGWRLLQNPSRLRVLTIDALNQSLARRLPVLSGLGAGVDIQQDARPLYELAAERLLSHLPADDARLAEAVGILLEHLDNRVDRLVGLIRAMLARREAWLPVLPADVEASGVEDAVRDRLEAGRVAIVQAHLAALVAAFPPALLEELSGYAAGAAQVLRDAGIEGSPILRCTRAVPGSDIADVPHWQGLAQFLLTGEGHPRRLFTSSVGVLPQAPRRPELAELKRRIVAACACLEHDEPLCSLLDATRVLPPVAYSEDDWRLLKSMLLVLRLAAVELKLVFAERHAVDYPEFAAAARQALGSDEEPTDTALALDARLRHVLVDEFQDTSEAQVRLLEALTAGWQRGDGRTLFLVGDPMQSIYRFRNAEVGLFLHVRAHGLGQVDLEPLTLRVNFRSTRPIVDWINQGFARVLSARDDVVQGAVRYSQSVAASGAGDDGGVTLHAFLRSSRQHEACAVADIVERRLAEFAAAAEASDDARIAVLVQGRGHLLQIVAELTRRGIAFQATDIDPLGGRPTVLDVIALTRALAHLADRSAWLGVLRAPWCGLTLADCHALLGDDLDAAVPRLLQQSDRLARLEPAARVRLQRCLPVFESALVEVSRLGLRDAVERAWHALGGPATLDDARGLDEVQACFAALGALEAEAPGMPVDLARLEEVLRELYAPARPRPGVRVELLTIHKSKGLQFDTVIVPGLDRVGRADDPRLLEWLKLPGRDEHGLVIAPIAAAGEEDGDLLHDWLGRLEREKLLQERRRLLYVAATRAERQLHLLGSCAVDVDRKTGALHVHRPRSGSALALLWAEPSVRAAFDARLADAGTFEGEAPRTAHRGPPLKRLPAEWRVPAPPVGPGLVVRDLRRTVAAPKVEFDWASETARHVGTVVHRELQRHARVGNADAPVVRRESQPREWHLRRHAIELAELGVPEDRRLGAATRVLDAIERALADERGRWVLQGPHRDARSELDLTGRVGDDVVRVIVDRTFIDVAGCRWIVDYKTSMHEGAGLEDFLDNERERYRPQLERYASLLRAWGEEPIRLGLYFPLLSAWREWAAGDVDNDTSTLVEPATTGA